MEISDAPEELFSLLHLMPAPEEFKRRIVDHLREHAVKKDDAIIDALAGAVTAAVKEHLTEGLPDFQTVLPADVSTFHQLMEGVTLR
ncbi:MAG: hypothetical protein JW863_22985 [Chitinispirillaceae bacterium]|nr:hypothetical protein [Chitinispirillaceae bacterium]